MSVQTGEAVSECAAGQSMCCAKVCAVCMCVQKEFVLCQSACACKTNALICFMQNGARKSIGVRQPREQKSHVRCEAKIEY